MLEESLVRHCSPTLAGLKSGSLFNYSYQSLDSLLKQINYWNTLCGHKGTSVGVARCRSQKISYLRLPAGKPEEIGLVQEFQHF